MDFDRRRNGRISKGRGRGPGTSRPVDNSRFPNECLSLSCPFCFPVGQLIISVNNWIKRNRRVYSSPFYSILWPSTGPTVTLYLRAARAPANEAVRHTDELAVSWPRPPANAISGQYIHSILSSLARHLIFVQAITFIGYSWCQKHGRIIGGRVGGGRVLVEAKWPLRPRNHRRERRRQPESHSVCRIHKGFVSSAAAGSLNAWPRDPEEAPENKCDTVRRLERPFILLLLAVACCNGRSIS